MVKKHNKSKKKPNKPNKPTSRNPNRKLEITFDKEKRKEYLANFSKRKRERRVFGLAMQKVKDRKVKLAERKNRRNDAKEKEKAYLDTYNALGLNDDDEVSDKEITRDEERVRNSKKQKYDSESGDQSCDEEESVLKENTTSKSFQDENTKNQFGGTVCVTITNGIPVDSDDEELEHYETEMAKKTGIDQEQKLYNSVEYYLKGVKETCGNKKKDAAKKHKGLYHKGKYGAQNMPGIAQGKDFKIASMALRKANAGRDFSGKGKGRRGKKRS